MGTSSRFTDAWEPKLLDEEVLASGTWTYADGTEYAARLVRRRWDYTSEDVPEIEANVSGVNIDYVDYAIGPDGNVYLWLFKGRNAQAESKHFSSAKEAENHIQTYSGVVNVRRARSDA
jgi:hypothetical protein